MDMTDDSTEHRFAVYLTPAAFSTLFATVAKLPTTGDAPDAGHWAQIYRALSDSTQDAYPA